jgi:hypothetical protein
MEKPAKVAAVPTTKLNAYDFKFEPFGTAAPSAGTLPGFAAG